MAKVCEKVVERRCLGTPVKGERFCPVCRAEMLRRMESSGYLTPLPPKTERRPATAREDRRATRFGGDD